MNLSNDQKYQIISKVVIVILACVGLFLLIFNNNITMGLLSLGLAGYTAWEYHQYKGK